MTQKTINRRHFNAMLLATTAAQLGFSASSAQTQSQSESTELIGPYEQWIYGEDSLDYNVWQKPEFNKRYIAAVVTRKAAPVSGETLQKNVKKSDGTDNLPLLLGKHSLEIKIPLWEEALKDNSRHQFIPILRDFGVPPTGKRLNADFFVEVLSAARIKGTPASPVPEDIGYRLNSPIPEEWIDLKHSTQPLDSSFKSDPDFVRSNNVGKLVIMAVIDDGIPFAHRNFRNTSGASSRIEFCWMQSAKATSSGTVPFGREAMRIDIENLIKKYGSDEDFLYAQSGLLDNSLLGTMTINHRSSHGAHVLDIAAGNRPEIDGNIDHMRIIAVQLPAPMTIDTTGFGKDAFVLSAFHYIFDRADRIAKAYLGDKNAKVKLVINFSYGFTGGPHDGKDRLEIAISNLIQARSKTGRETQLIMAAGNTFNSRMNGEIAASQLNSNQRTEIPWRIQPNDLTSNYLEIWISAHENLVTYSVDITDGLGKKLFENELTIDPASTNRAAIINKIKDNKKTIGQFGLDRYNTDWWRMTVFIAPTESHNPKLAVAASGLWKIGLKKTGPDVTNKIVCRIQRDNDPFGYSRGARQSYFDHPQDKLYNDDGSLSRLAKTGSGFVSKFGTLNGLATHNDVIVVSGYYDDTGRATEYSAAFEREKTPTNHRSAPSDDSTAMRGILAAGTRSGIVTRLSGTSVAAPQVARQIALGQMQEVQKPQPDPSAFPLNFEEKNEQAHRLGLKLPKKFSKSH